MKKDSFVLYNSFYEPIKTLKNEQLGKLLRAIFNYTINGEITQEQDILVAFMFIKNQLDIDNDKWEKEKQKRSEAGKKGMASRWNNNDNSVITDDNKNNSVINAITKITDNVNVNVNDNVLYKKENIIKEKRFKKPTLEEIQDYCKERNNNIDAQSFIDFYESKGWKVGNQSMKDWKACIRTWERRNIPSKKIIEQVPDWFNKQIEANEISEEEEIAFRNKLKSMRSDGNDK